MVNEILTKERKGPGWRWLAFRIGGVLAILFLVYYATTFIFHTVYSSDETTATLVEYQNHYLAFTDAFITSEDLIVETTADPTILTRFFSQGILVFLGSGLIALLIGIIPFTRKALPYVGYFMFLPMAMLVFIHSSFFPSLKTEFDRKEKKMILTTYQYYFIPTKKEIPFEWINGFDYSFYDFTNYSTRQHAEVIWIYAFVGNQRVLIGGNRIGTHPAADTTWSERVELENKEKLQALVASMRKLITAK
jgi:hypothetical protein